jgi:protein TilB
MVRITEDLIRKRAEHNELMISTLQEISLHQLDIEKIENIDKWCRDLKILYLHNNLIRKIENVGRLKQLEYLNLTLNCIEKIENLENCENLNKLDFTANFIGDLRCISHLRKNKFLRILYLTGNPCIKYNLYRDYVINNLPQLTELDGQKIEKSERLKATQQKEKAEKSVLEESFEYSKKRERQKKEFELRQLRGEIKTGDEFWNEVEEDTPESRIQMHHERERQKTENESRKPMFEKPKYERHIKFFNSSGEPMNVNEAGLDFRLDEDDSNEVILRLFLPKFLDTQLIDVDAQPKYVRVKIKGKSFQVVFRSEVKPDDGKCERSQLTGEMKITLPKLFIDPRYEQQKEVEKITINEKKETKSPGYVNYRTIVADNEAEIERLKSEKLKSNFSSKRTALQRENDDGFQDSDDVPPLI